MPWAGRVLLVLLVGSRPEPAADAVRSVIAAAGAAVRAIVVLVNPLAR